MGFRGEVRQFMRDYYNWRKKKDVEKGVLRDTIRELRIQNEELMDRLLARNLPEFKTFTLPEVQTTEVAYDPLADEDNAGEILTLPSEEAVG